MDRPAAQRGWLGFGLLALVVLGAPLAWLLMNAGPEFQTHRMERWSWDDSRFITMGCRVRSLPMERKVEEADGYKHSVVFVETDAMPREGLRSVELLFDVRKPDAPNSEEKRVTRLVRGELRNTQTGEIWTAHPIRRFRTEDRVVFERARSLPGGPAAWETAAGTNAPQQWEVTLWTHDPVSVGVRCHFSTAVVDGKPPSHPGKWAFRVPVSLDKVQWAYPHGRYTTWTEGEPMSRARVVAAIWDRGGAGWVWCWMGLALGMVVAGVAGMAGPVEPGTAMRAWRAGMSLGLVFGGIGLIQLILHPAFQGADEPVHVMSWHVLAKDDAAIEETMGFGRRVHYDRLMGRAHQHITSADVGHPHDFFVESLNNWGLKPLARSATAARVSQLFGWWVSGRPPAVQVFRMRLVSLVLVSVAVALAGALLARGKSVQPGEHWLGWCLVMVPSLGYFAMNVSNYPILLSCYVVLAAALASMVNRAEPSWRVMLVVGLALGVLVQTSVNGVLTSTAVVFGLLGVALFRFRDSGAEEPREPIPGVGGVGWGAMALGLLLARVFSTEEYDLAMAGTFRAQLARWGWSWIPPYWLFVCVACAGLWLLERMARTLRWLEREGRGRRPVWLTMVALLILLGLLWNAFRTAPHLGMLMEAVPGWEYLPGQEQLLPPIGLPAPPDPAPTPGGYARSVVESFLASWGPGDADYMTSVLFWQLDGYLDTLMPGWIRQFLTTFLACGLALSFWRISERRNRGRLGRLLLVLVGVGAALVLLAVGSRSSVASPSIHGRYLIGVYVLLIPVMFLGWKGLMVRWERTSPRKLAWFLVGPMLLLQTVAIATTIHRYLG